MAAMAPPDKGATGSGATRAPGQRAGCETYGCVYKSLWWCPRGTGTFLVVLEGVIVSGCFIFFGYFVFFVRPRAAAWLQTWSTAWWLRGWHWWLLVWWCGWLWWWHGFVVETSEFLIRLSDDGMHAVSAGLGAP